MNVRHRTVVAINAFLSLPEEIRRAFATSVLDSIDTTQEQEAVAERLLLELCDPEQRPWKIEHWDRAELEADLSKLVRENAEIDVEKVAVERALSKYTITNWALRQRNEHQRKQILSLREDLARAQEVEP